jgi:hypothetical protein
MVSWSRRQGLFGAGAAVLFALYGLVTGDVTFLLMGTAFVVIFSVMFVVDFYLL